MEVLVVNGFDLGGPTEIVDALEHFLIDRGHGVHRTELAADGFDTFMSAEERTAYHSEQPLITPEAAAGAVALRASDAIVVCYPIIHGTAPPRIKSWQERVFVLGVGFEFKPSGRITGALDHLRRACVIGVGIDHDARPSDRRNDYGPCLARAFHLSSNRRCKSRYLEVRPDATIDVEQHLTRW